MIWDALFVGGICAVSLVYAIGVRRLWRAAGRGRGVRPWQALTFACGQITLVAALVSPLDALADFLFSAHMAQHELLMLVAAPLLVVGRPITAVLWGLPAAPRRRLGRAMRAPVTLAVWRAATGPVTVLVVHALVIFAWHVPALFEGAMRNESVHAFQHLTMFASAGLFWWALVHGRYGRAGYGVSVLYVFATGMNQTVLGALITVARVLWYPIYSERTAAHGLSPLEDQQLAGLFMWIPAGVIFMVIALALFAAWVGDVARRDPAADAALARLVSERDA